MNKVEQYYAKSIYEGQNFSFQVIQDMDLIEQFFEEKFITKPKSRNALCELLICSHDQAIKPVFGSELHENMFMLTRPDENNVVIAIDFEKVDVSKVVNAAVAERPELTLRRSRLIDKMISKMSA